MIWHKIVLNILLIIKKHFKCLKKWKINYITLAHQSCSISGQCDSAVASAIIPSASNAHNDKLQYKTYVGGVSFVQCYNCYYSCNMSIRAASLIWRDLSAGKCHDGWYSHKLTNDLTMIPQYTGKYVMDCCNGTHYFVTQWRLLIKLSWWGYWTLCMTTAQRLPLR